MVPGRVDLFEYAALGALAACTAALAASRRRARPRAGSIVPMEGDGNCLFRALAHPERDHAQVRAQVARHLTDHWGAYSCFLDDEERPGYLRAVATSGVWGDELVLSAYSDLYGEPVEVYQGSPSAPRLTRRYGAREGGATAPRRVFFSVGGHYDALELGAPAAA